MMMMKFGINRQCILSGVLFLWLSIGRCQSYAGSTPPSGIACQPCDNMKCVDWRTLNCKHGYTLDVCQCCYQCAVGEDSICGGSQNVYGTCGIGMYCKYSSSSGVFDETIQRFGKCTSVKGMPGSDSYKPPGVLHEAELVSKQPPEEISVTKPSSVKQSSNKFKNSGDIITTPETSNEEKVPYDYLFPSFSFSFPPAESSTGPGEMMKDDPNHNRRLDYSPNPKCEPLCTAEFCENNKRAVCSALNKVHSRGGSCNSECHHTSCLTCNYAADISACGQCDGSDKQCLKKFGICIKDTRLKAKRAPETYLNNVPTPPQDGVKYVCTIPDCPM